MRTPLRARSGVAVVLLGASVLFASTAAAVGCTGVIGDDSGSIDGPGGPGGGPGGTPGENHPDALVDSTRFPRLTHAQWENTVRDLLKLAERPGLSTSFTTDPPGSTFGNDGNLLKVTPNLWGDYQRAAEALADDLTADAAKLGKLLPAGLPESGDARIRGFVEAFGKRAFRRPLEAAEIDRFVALFKQGPQLTSIADTFTAGVNLVVQTMLQSPSFVYRVELGEAKPDGTVGLTAWETASRLSYALWNTMPDDALFAAVEDGSLATEAGFAAQAKRLLDDPRAEPMIEDFHAKLLQLDHFDGVKKDLVKFPEWESVTSTFLKREAELFVRDVAITSSGGLNQLLTADYTFVNSALAPLYGLSGSFGDEFQKVKLDASKRAGFLTQIGFLASNAAQKETDPIHRGVFVNLKIICADLPPPPNVIPPLPPPVEGKTTRDRVSAHTGKGTCGAGCHGTMINPAGFAFESFDAAGKWRTTDNGIPVNTADTYPFEDGPQSYSGPVEFAKVLAARPQVHRCYVGNWLEYAYGRRKATGDGALVARVAGDSLAGASTKDVILKLVLAKSFTHRPATSGAEGGS